ncbi:aminoglycoside phosphotransferase family protein [Streptomyces sp. NPDC057696]|uniref:aminoglycoside phosphotransferase family protein n=1 Tax=Streptomyces sp. NPDC057696 TaxID=3346218 RepID=UPI0036974853
MPLGFALALLLRTVPFGKGKCRVPRDVIEAVPRIWPRESDVLRVVSRHLSEVPPCLADFGDWSLHSFRAGMALSDVNPDGAVDDELMASFAEFFVRTAGVPVSELPPLPANWPGDGDSEGFLYWLVDFTERRVHRANRDRFGSLFDALLIPERALADFKRSHSGLTSRPFRLLHTDVHRANVVVNDRRITVIDWEMAIYGDPLHELATHMVRMGYGKVEQARMTLLWGKAMERADCAALTDGLSDDLPAYLDFEYAQSLFTDVMRAAMSLPVEPSGDEFQDAARRVCVAMGLAREPLQLMEVPDMAGTLHALRDWHSSGVGTPIE